jgi:hypothetical protein
MSHLTLEPSPLLAALKHNGVPALRRLRVEEAEQIVILTGTVSSYYLKQLAQEAVIPLLAGRKLLNRVEVVRD